MARYGVAYCVIEVGDAVAERVVHVALHVGDDVGNRLFDLRAELVGVGPVTYETENRCAPAIGGPL
jgi:hypothetical protein